VRNSKDLLSLFQTKSLIKTRSKIIILFLLLSLQFQAQLDSLLRVTATMPDDTNRLNNYLEISSLYKHYSVPDSCILFANKAALLSKKFKNNLKFIEAKYDIAIAISYMGKRDSSITILSELEHQFAKDTAQSTQKWMAVLYNSLGIFYMESNKYEQSINYHIKSLKIKEKNKNKKGIVYSYNNIANVYLHMLSYGEAKKNYEKALAIAKEIDFDKKFPTIYMNLGNVYFKLRDLKKAKEYLLINLQYLNGDDKYVEAKTYTNLGAVYLDLKNLDSAEYYFNKSLDLRLKINDVNYLHSTYIDLSRLNALRGNKTKSEEYLKKGIEYCEKINSIYETREIYRNVSDIYRILGNTKLENEYLRNLFAIDDSISVIEQNKMVSELNEKYETEKKDAHIQLLNKDKEISDAQLKRRSFERNVFIGGLAFVILISLFIFNRFKISQKQKKIIEKQKLEVEKTHALLAEHHKEIQDSIKYAKRIQEAILPSMDAMQNGLKDGFVLYKPKDVVAGDFYWMEKHHNKIYFAAADCTGHGVPGAMVSVVCSNALSKALLEEDIVETGKLLDRTRELVIERFAKSGENVKDGMDISICAIDFENMNLQWSGANNPLWMIRAGELLETKPDKQPIGMHQDPRPFRTHAIPLLKSDTIYISTDGYQDQFGGKKQKKYMAKQLKANLLEIHNENMNRQKEILDQKFELWKGPFEQVDDVCIIGVRI